MRFLLVAFLLLFPALSSAGSFAVAKSTSVVTTGVSGANPIVSVATPYTFTQTTAANAPVFGGAANAAQYSLGSGAGSPAANIASAALGVGVAAAGLFASPVVATAIGALTVGMAGYQFYQSVKSNGITFDSAGNSGVANHGIFCFGTVCGATWQEIFNQNQGVGQSWYGAPAGVVLTSRYVDYGTYMGMFGSGWVYGTDGLTAFRSYSDPTKNPTFSPATNAQVQAAIDLAVADPAVAADAVEFAKQRGINPLSFIPTSAPNLNPAPWSVTLPDGTVVTVSPATTLGGQDVISPSPSSTTAAPTPTPTPTSTTQTSDAAAIEAARQEKAAQDAASGVTMPDFMPKFSDLLLPLTNPFAESLPAIPLPSSDGGCVSLDVSLPVMGNISIAPCGVVAAVQPMINWMIIILGVFGGLLVWLRGEVNA
jgi:hypothetical protein